MLNTMFSNCQQQKKKDQIKWAQKLMGGVLRTRVRCQLLKTERITTTNTRIWIHHPNHYWSRLFAGFLFYVNCKNWYERLTLGPSPAGPLRFGSRQQHWPTLYADCPPLFFLHFFICCCSLFFIFKNEKWRHAFRRLKNRKNTISIHLNLFYFCGETKKKHSAALCESL